MAANTFPSFDTVPSGWRLFVTDERWKKMKPETQALWEERFATTPQKDWSQTTWDIFASFAAAESWTKAAAEPEPAPEPAAAAKPATPEPEPEPEPAAAAKPATPEPEPAAAAKPATPVPRPGLVPQETIQNSIMTNKRHKGKIFKQEGPDVHPTDWVSGTDKEGRTVEGKVKNVFNNKIFVLTGNGTKTIMIENSTVTEVQSGYKRKKKKAGDETVRMPKAKDTVWFKFQTEGQTFMGTVLSINKQRIKVQSNDSMAPVIISKDMIHKVRSPGEVESDPEPVSSDEGSDDEESEQE
jgi:hypothetical protein